MSICGGRGPHSQLGDLHHGQAVRKAVFGRVFRLPERRLENLVGKILKTAFCVFLMYFWYGFMFTKWEKQRASLNFVTSHSFRKIWDFFVPRTYWQFLVKCQAKAWISFARPWKNLYNLLIKHTNWKNALAFKFSIRFDFFGRKVNL